MTEKPTSRILTQEDLDVFLQSKTLDALLEFVLALRDACKGRVNSFDCGESNAVTATLQLLEDIEKLTIAHSAVSNEKSRFGNPAFRDFYDDLDAKLPSLLESSYPSLSNDEVVELRTYLLESFGNRTRIDYGSGHELNFMCFLLCLFRLDVFDESDYTRLVLHVFNRYIALMRTIQSQYWLEPAGSHGVWGLDDYHFLPFLFGASQLVGHKYLRPRSIHDSEIVEMYAKEYMYLGAINFINSVKTASLRWSSPMLDDISGVKTWDKVSEGMVKMYKAEVLGKVPIMQHFMFGKILPIGPLPSESLSEEDKSTSHDGHVHGEGVFGDCCGIKVPSAIAASTLSHNGELRSVRPIPFD
ncbi:hypothetical protein V1512DRAFT_257318 [Lipomyces arxii]|uniref:uncharacterized protein n=1 Tax=Lipomyces arxii TaxID=56418 RepID=UPI0034CD4FFD